MKGTSSALVIVAADRAPQPDFATLLAMRL
jgi:hypothetical protein